MILKELHKKKNEVLRTHPKIKDFSVDEALKTSDLGHIFGDEVVEELLGRITHNSLNQCCYSQGETLLKKGDKADYIYIVARGILLESQDRDSDLNEPLI